ncbi:MAG: UDP-N-acetylmuramoyl-L-alanine--D-glutamate ligase, partial [Endozoicomonas sp.]
TGLSCARYLHSRGLTFRVMDTRQVPPGIEELRQQFPDIMVHTGGFNEEWLTVADELVISPGIPLSEPAIDRAIHQGAVAVGDIELFCREVNRRLTERPLVAITGSNGKSTVTTLVGEMIRESGLTPGVGGNIGTPALDLLDREGVDAYVLELSSFQLETTDSIRATAATVLNVTPDHMDRYATLADYHKAKQRIYRGCATAVFNRDDPLTSPLLPVTAGATTFSSRVPDLGQMGLLVDGDGTWLCRGLEKRVNASQMRLKGRHNQLNALAAMALGEAIGLEADAMVRAIIHFSGLPHRCQWLAEYQGVNWFNDSKATNVGAAVAAIEGLGEGLDGQIVLIAGGDGKGADFSELKPAVAKHVSHLVLIGRDASQIEEAVDGVSKVHHVGSLEEAVRVAGGVSGSGDAVLLAPACASFDMFNSFEHRGEQFAERVGEWCRC